MLFIYSYEPPKAQVVRRFLNLGIQRANPSEYVARYGAQLEDSQSLVTHARQAGVVEDIVSLFQFNSFILLISRGLCWLLSYDFFSSSHLLLVQYQVFNHPFMNQVVLVLVVLVLVLLHPQLAVMMLVVVFLQPKVLVLIWLVVLVESHQVVMNHHRPIVQVVVLRVAMLKALNHHLVTLVLLTT